MAIYTISDLHLSLNKEKPMDIFGENWTKHSEKIKSNWQEQVKENDIVLMPGDFSWAMNLKDTYDEFKEKIEQGYFIMAHWDGTAETE